MDVLFAFPVMLLAIGVIAVLGPHTWSAAVAIAVVYTPIFARLLRGPALVICESEYVTGARAIGASDARIVFRHVLPNLASVVLVQTSLLLSAAILVEASLSFLGLGTQPPTPSLGLMLSEGRNFLLLSPWSAVFAGFAILFLSFGFNLLGDALRDTLDPRLRGSREGAAGPSRRHPGTGRSRGPSLPRRVRRHSGGGGPGGEGFRLLQGAFLRALGTDVGGGDGEACLGFSLVTDGHIDMLFVDPAVSRRGVGAALLRDAERKGARSLECFRDNAGARAFYEHHGWRVAEEYERPFLGRDRPFVLYRREVLTIAVRIGRRSSSRAVPPRRCPLPGQSPSEARTRECLAARMREPRHAVSACGRCNAFQMINTFMRLAHG